MSSQIILAIPRSLSDSLITSNNGRIGDTSPQMIEGHQYLHNNSIVFQIFEPSDNFLKISQFKITFSS